MVRFAAAAARRMPPDINVLGGRVREREKKKKKRRKREGERQGDCFFFVFLLSPFLSYLSRHCTLDT